MKVVWIVNTAIPQAPLSAGERRSTTVTWLENMFCNIKEDAALVVGYPDSKSCLFKKEVRSGVTYYGVPRKHWRGDKYEKEMKVFFRQIFQQERPDVIHIWGTEFPHTFSAVEAAEECGILERTVISIQGLVSVYARHFMGGVPFWVRYFMVPKNLIRGYNLYLTKQSFEKRGIYEIKALQKVSHVIGRTAWDQACTAQINPGICYHKNNESMRDVFYHRKWEYASCVPHRIFLSQGGSPIKGMHILLEAMQILKRKYPAVHLFVTGRNVLGMLSTKQRLSLNPYDWYIRREIKKRDLKENVSFLGDLSAQQMCEQYLAANAFVLASCIENSPNSLGEAMLLGTPCIAADVGGVTSLAESSEAFIYPWDEPYMLAYYLDKVFQGGEKISQMSENARNRAMRTYDVRKNAEDLLHIYRKISMGEAEEHIE